MPPRTPGTLSNGVLSLKFMQRGLAADQKPVEAEKAKLVDDSHWEIVHPPEKMALINTERQKGLDVTYEASYLPFLYDSGDSKSDDTPGPSLPSTSAIAYSGRRVFRGGQEVRTQDIAATEPQEEPQEGSRDSSPITEETGDALPKPKYEKPPRPLLRKRTYNDKPEFKRPAGVDVPAAQTPKAEPRGKSRSDLLSEMIASAKGPTPSVTTPANMGLSGEARIKREAADEDDDARPRKKPKKTKGGALP